VSTQPSTAATTIATTRVAYGSDARFSADARAAPAVTYATTRAIESARCFRSRSANAASESATFSDAWNASRALSAAESTPASTATTIATNQAPISTIIAFAPARAE
jgi:hypothetical protein